MKYLNLTLLVIALFSFACWIGNWSENHTLRERLDQQEGILSQMKAEHELALSAAGDAMKAREEVREYQRQRMCEAERALGNNPEWCNIPVPSDVMLHYQSTNPNANPSLPAAGGTAN